MSNENRLLSSVHSVTRLLSSSVNPDNALQLMLEAAIQAVEASGGSILLHDAARKQLWFSLVLGGEAQGATHHASAVALFGEAIQDDEGIAGQVFQSLKPHIDNSIGDNPQHARRIDEQFEYTTRNLITVPLIYPGGQPFGVMQLLNKIEGDFTEDDLIVLDIVANISSMNVYNSNLAAEARRTKSLDYLGRIIHDVENKVVQLDGPLRALTAAQECALTTLGADESIRKELADKAATVSAGIHDLMRYTEFMAGAVAGEPFRLNRVDGDLLATIERQLVLLDSVVTDRGVALMRDYHPDPALVFPFDSFLIERAVYNLVNNALKATPAEGTITVTVALEGESAVISVQDTGMGMQPNVLARILTGNSTAPASGGPGLSTSIVREVAEMHGGVFEGSSQPGAGTTFRLRLPIHIIEEA